MSGVIAFANSISSNLLIWNLKSFYTMYVDVLPYEELNMRGLSKGRFEEIIISEAGTLSVKPFCCPGRHTALKTTIHLVGINTNDMKRKITLVKNVQTEVVSQLNYQPLRPGVSTESFSKLNIKKQPQVTIAKSGNEETKMPIIIKTSSTTDVNMLKSNIITMAFDAALADTKIFTPPPENEQHRTVAPSFANPNKVQILQNVLICDSNGASGNWKHEHQTMHS